ncbi:hypothetical protein FZEAL_1053 [Fusarium zealandicum]|uniref:Uncharacterized protein n=1 Tax=Fusarium zealandicum TaxID=1053134 RepID=A0A8H4UUB1_9HYPO|nr:hypothetical protein FZEAL_1053 [Fusarium zealandicum]
MSGWLRDHSPSITSTSDTVEGFSGTSVPYWNCRFSVEHLSDGPKPDLVSWLAGCLFPGIGVTTFRGCAHVYADDLVRSWTAMDNAGRCGGYGQDDPSLHGDSDQQQSNVSPTRNTNWPAGLPSASQRQFNGSKAAMVGEEGYRRLSQSELGTSNVPHVKYWYLSAEA